MKLPTHPHYTEDWRSLIAGIRDYGAGPDGAGWRDLIIAIELSIARARREGGDNTWTCICGRVNTDVVYCARCDSMRNP